MMQVERIPLPVDRHGYRDETAWHALRAADYTASEMGALFGVGQRSTALSVYVRKAGLATADKGSKYTRRGHILEPVVAAELERRWPNLAIAPADVYLRGRDPDAPHLRLGATKDFDMTGDGRRRPLEIKTVAPRWFRRWWRGPGGKVTPPLDHILQLRTQMLLDDADGGVLACLVCDDAADIFAFRIERNPRIEAEICRRVCLFWEAFDAGRWPRLQYGREAKALDAIRRQTHTPPPLAAAPRLAELATLHTAELCAEAEAKRRRLALEDEIRELMAAEAVVLLPDARRITVGPKTRVKIT